MKKLIFAILTVFIFTQCTAIFENTIKNELIGTWEVESITDEGTGEKIIVDYGDIVLLFGNVLCDAIEIKSNGEFKTYNLLSNSNAKNGDWEYEFLELTLDFNDGYNVTRKFSISEDELTVADTISGKAKSVVFNRVE